MNSAMRGRNAKWVSYIIGGVIFKIFIILVFLYVILRVRNIKLVLHSPKVENLITSDGSVSHSLSMLLHTQLTIKNSNFGHYKFKNSTVVLEYRGKHVGETGLGNGSVKARSKKMIIVVVGVSLKTSRTSVVTGDGGLGKITLTAIAQLTGKVHTLKVIRRRKVVKMNCTMDVDTKTQAILNLHCN